MSKCQSYCIGNEMNANSDLFYKKGIEIKNLVLKAIYYSGKKKKW